MAKKRKTREQKRLADSRHKFEHSFTLVNHSLAQASPHVTTVKLGNLTNTTPVNMYPFLKKDLSKTAILTMGILIFQLILFVVLKNHIFIIPGLTY